MMIRMRGFFLLSLGALLLATGATAVATTLARMSVERMAQTAPLIVRARCVANSTIWDAGDIWTFTQFDVEELWRGTAPARITVRLLGGRAGNLTSSVSGVPRFQPGEEVILFLEPTPRADFTVVSWEQGTFRVRRDAGSGVQTATQDTSSFESFDPVTRRFETSGVSRVPLDQFRARIDAAFRDETRRKP